MMAFMKYLMNIHVMNMHVMIMLVDRSSMKTFNVDHSHDQKR